MSKRVKLCVLLSAVTVVVCMGIAITASVLHRGNDVSVAVESQETYEELTKPAELVTENNVSKDDPSYADVDYLFREYIHDNSITTGEITLDGYEINPGSGDLRIYGTRDGVSWEHIKVNEGKE